MIRQFSLQINSQWVLRQTLVLSLNKKQNAPLILVIKLYAVYQRVIMYRTGKTMFARVIFNQGHFNIFITTD